MKNYTKLSLNYNQIRTLYILKNVTVCHYYQDNKKNRSLLTESKAYDSLKVFWSVGFLFISVELFFMAFLYAV